MTYEHLRTHEEDFEIDRDILEEDGWEIISVSQGMIYWKRFTLNTDGPVKDVTEFGDVPATDWIPPTILPYEPYTYPNTWPNPFTPVKPNEIYVTFNSNNTNTDEIVQAIADRLAK